MLERASKLAFLSPEPTSEYARAWSAYFAQSASNPSLATPPAWLDQPKYRSPTDYAEIKFGMEQMMEQMGDDGVYPLDRRRNAEMQGLEKPIIVPHTIMLVSHRAANCRRDRE